MLSTTSHLPRYVSAKLSKFNLHSDLCPLVGYSRDFQPEVTWIKIHPPSFVNALFYLCNCSVGLKVLFRKYTGKLQEKIGWYLKIRASLGWKDSCSTVDLLHSPSLPFGSCNTDWSWRIRVSWGFDQGMLLQFWVFFHLLVITYLHIRFWSRYARISFLMYIEWVALETIPAFVF